jgi:hypothetical protein
MSPMIRFGRLIWRHSLRRCFWFGRRLEPSAQRSELDACGKISRLASEGEKSDSQNRGTFGGNLDLVFILYFGGL